MGSWLPSVPRAEEVLVRSAFPSKVRLSRVFINVTPRGANGANGSRMAFSPGRDRLLFLIEGDSNPSGPQPMKAGREPSPYPPFSVCPTPGGSSPEKTLHSEGLLNPWRCLHLASVGILGSFGPLHLDTIPWPQWVPSDPEWPLPRWT